MRRAALRATGIAELLLQEAGTACCTSGTGLASSQRHFAAGQMRRATGDSRSKRDVRRKRRDILRILGSGAPSDLWMFGAASPLATSSAQGAAAAAPSSSSSGDAPAAGDNSGGGADGAAAGSFFSWVPMLFKKVKQGSKPRSNPDLLALPDPDDPSHSRVDGAAAARAPAVAAAGTDAAAAVKGAGSDDDAGGGWALLRKKKKEEDTVWDMVIKQRKLPFYQFLMQINQHCAGSIEPRPRTPRRFGVDADRIEFLRLRQFIRIGEMLSDSEKEAITADPEAVLWNPVLMAQMAESTQYSVAEVRDMLKEYARMRGMFNCIAALRAAGRPMPQDTGDAWHAAYRAWMKEQAAADEEAVLRRRDPAACALHAWGRALGPRQQRARVKCARTGLRYGECCGALARSPATGNTAVGGHPARAAS